jgi:hypothetical protein
MATTDETVLEFIGGNGRSLEAIAARFPSFDVARLVRAQLIEIAEDELAETVAHHNEPSVEPVRYVLTSRGAEAVGIDAQ